MLTAEGWLGGTNFGGDERGRPALAGLLSVYAAGVYFVPPVRDGARFLGETALTGGGEG